MSKNNNNTSGSAVERALDAMIETTNTCDTKTVGLMSKHQVEPLNDEDATALEKLSDELYTRIKDAAKLQSGLSSWFRLQM